ncbi:hypothetical protein J6590_004235 [Homalodisca vitripennis]|nr:hypothetical protein J6590_004235 [Homalodisca vitripennis]
MSGEMGMSGGWVRGGRDVSPASVASESESGGVGGRGPCRRYRFCRRPIQTFASPAPAPCLRIVLYYTPKILLHLYLTCYKLNTMIPLSDETQNNPFTTSFDNSPFSMMSNQRMQS